MLRTPNYPLFFPFSFLFLFRITGPSELGPAHGWERFGARLQDTSLHPPTTWHPHSSNTYGSSLSSVCWSPPRLLYSGGRGVAQRKGVLYRAFPSSSAYRKRSYRRYHYQWSPGGTRTFRYGPDSLTQTPSRMTRTSRAQSATASWLTKRIPTKAVLPFCLYISLVPHVLYSL